MHRHTFQFGEYTSTLVVLERKELWTDLGDASLFVTDTNTARFVPAGASNVSIPAGEESKSWSELERILSAMLEANLDRKSTVVGLGGGVVCDIASLAANLYMRGCRLVLAPTTLLSMVDASLGGKTGVNFGGFKNMVGTFYPASEVRVCVEYLHTLPQREYLGGLAEVIKSAMLGDEELFAILESKTDAILTREDSLLGDMVRRCLMVKGRIVEEDLRERGVRAYLNLGHTFAHALESTAGLGSWSHGEAVAWGLERAMEAGVASGLTDPAYARRVSALLLKFGYRTEPMPEMAGRLFDAMARDKKRTSGVGKLILQESICVTSIVDFESELVQQVLRGEKVLDIG